MLNNIVAILISSLITVIIAQYTFQSQDNKELITQIVTNLNNDYMFAFYCVMGIYGLYGVLEELSNIKYEYYILVKNVIEEVIKEKDKYINRRYYRSYMNKKFKN